MMVTLNEVSNETISILNAEKDGSEFNFRN